MIHDILDSFAGSPGSVLSIPKLAAARKAAYPVFEYGFESRFRTSGNEKGKTRNLPDVGITQTVAEKGTKIRKNVATTPGG